MKRDPQDANLDGPMVDLLPLEARDDWRTTSDLQKGTARCCQLQRKDAVARDGKSCNATLDWSWGLLFRG
jgi:hypothetical protein